MKRVLFWASAWLFTWLIQNEVRAQGQVCLTSTHKYYQAVTISNGGSALSNYQVRLTVNTSTPVAASKMLSNGNDIRFTDANCNNLPYWIESGMNSASTVIWVKVTSVPAGNSSIYMYYGYTSAAAASDGDATFDLFDDFNGSSVNASKWNTYKSSSASISISGGLATFSNSAAGADVILRSVNSFTNPIIIESNITNNNTYGGGIGLTPSGSFSNGVMSEKYNTSIATLNSTASCNSYAFTSGYASGMAYANGIWGIYWTATNNSVHYVGSNSYTMPSTGTVPSSIQAAIGLPCINWSGSTASFTADWIRLRKYAATVPTFSFGTEYPNYNVDISGTALYPSGTASTTFCGGNYLYITCNVFGYYPSNFYAYLELSDASGSFSSPTVLGTVSGGTGPYTLSNLQFVGLIPSNIPFGTGYRIRFRNTTNPVYSGTLSAALTIGAMPTSTNYSINNAAQCNESDNFTFTASGSIATGNTRAFTWDYGDGNTGTGSPSSHGYASEGSYNVKMIVYNSGVYACRDSITKVVTVHPQPYAGLDNYNGCTRDNHFFASWASGIAYGYIADSYFDFGDGNNTTISGVGYTQHQYSTYGAYSVRLIVISDKGCKDTMDKVEYSYPEPKVAWTNDLACDGRNVQFHGNTTVIGFQSSKVSSYYWDFGDAGQGNDRNPQHMYGSSGTYSVYVTSYTNYGCWDTLRKNVVVNPTPKAAFNVQNACQGAGVNLTNLSVINPASTLNYWWNLGNSTTSTAANPSTTYTQQGTFSIKLIATASSGCTDSTVKDVTIYGLPKAQFASNEVCSGLQTDFHNYSVGASAYKWTFIPAQTSTASDPGFTFSGAGSWPVKLVVSTANGCKDSITNNAIVNPVPAVSFTASTPSNCLRANKFTFANTSSISAGSNSYNWEFGDNTVSSATSPVKSYFGPGTFSVTLNAESDKGCKANTSQNVTVYPHPVSRFVAPNVCQAQSVNFNNISTISSGTISSHLWGFGDASTSSAANPSHGYSAAGTYLAALVETSNFGCKDTSAQLVSIWPMPNVNFTGTDECFGLATKFTNTSTVSSGVLLAHNWSFGDAGTGSEISPTHVYNAPGTYNVTLVSSTDKGCSGIATHSVNIWPKPVANFTLTNVCAGSPSTFTNTSTVGSGSITANAWNFGDGNTANSSNAINTYASFGTYQVNLAITSDKGCQATITKEARVYRQPVAVITTSQTKTNVLNPVISFSDNSLFGDYSEWDFGFNGRKSFLGFDTCAYTKPGKYTVHLKASTADNCTDNDTVIINVENAYSIFFPNAFTPNNDNLNEGFGAVGVFPGIQAYSLKVLDGRGRELFSTTSINIKWNGKLQNNGVELPTGNYAWFAEYTDYLGKQHKVNGLVSLRR